MESKNKPGGDLTRRSFLYSGAAAGAAAALPAGSAAGRSAFLDLQRLPDAVTAYLDRNQPQALERAGAAWRGPGLTVATPVAAAELAITIRAEATAIERLHLRWALPVDRDLLVLGDAWERSYGDLGWRGLVPERVLPWYFATRAGDLCHAYGVKTGAGALCFWQLDAQGVSLWLDLRNGGSGVVLGDRVLAAATVVTRPGQPGEDTTAALRAFCRQMCSLPTPLIHPVYGFNDWYYAYGHNTARQILADTDLLASLAAGNTVRPFSVIDDGWVDGSDRFPSMATLAREIPVRGVRPGIWVRPTRAPADAPPALLLPAARRERARELAWDVTIPEAREAALTLVKQVTAWGYEMVKHDFSTYDLLGRWGFEMGAEPTVPGWSFHDRGRTNAEILRDWYRALRQQCGPDTVLLGCNTVGHLGQGLFEVQRTGDDTSGKLWERTRRMGVNTLAFRLPQHGSFFVQDADCVGLSAAVPWEKNRQWLDLLARSGTALFVSPGEGARGAEQQAAVRAAFALAAAGGSGARPAELVAESAPGRWVAGDGRHDYDWTGPDGAWPFSV